MTIRERRVVIWGGVLVVGAVLALRVIPRTLRAVETLRVSTAEQVALRARAHSLLESREPIGDSLRQAFRQIVALAPRLVDGISGTEAQASLSSLLSMAAGRHAIRVVRVDPLPDSAIGVFNRVSIHAELEGDIRGLSGLLRAIETRDPLLTVNALTVTVAETPGAPGQPEILRIELSVSGYYVPRSRRP